MRIEPRIPHRIMSLVHTRSTTLLNAPDLRSHDVIKWKYFPRCWSFVRGVRRSPVDSTKASDAELWCFLWSAPEHMGEQTIQTPVIDTIVLIMTVMMEAIWTIEFWGTGRVTPGSGCYDICMTFWWTTGHSWNVCEGKKLFFFFTILYSTGVHIALVEEQDGRNYVACTCDVAPQNVFHNDVMKWKHFPRYWPFGHRWIPLTKASDTELWCFLWSAPEQTVE